jgi:anaerobic magnesium-protoporphyrin IX monomethyl ester cyclase
METIVDIILIHPPYHRRLGSGRVFPIGLGYLASSAEKQGFKVAIVDCALQFGSLLPESLSRLKDWLANKLESIHPRHAIGIGPCTTSAIRGIKAVAAICRQVHPNTPLIYGGPLASLPNQSRLFFDKFDATAVVPGDGEEAICSILNTLSNGGELSSLNCISSHTHIAPINVIQDIDMLPFPRREWDIEQPGYALSIRRDLFSDRFATMITSRGCPYTCNFCVSNRLRNGLYSKRSLENVINEIQELQLSHGVGSIVFYDDTFFLGPDKLNSDITLLAGCMSKLNKPLTWQIELRPDMLAAINRSMADKLFVAGCRQLNIGIEKVDIANSNFMGKQVNVDNIKRAVEEIRKGAPLLRLTGTYILGGPQETPDSAKKIIDQAIDLGLIFSHFYPLEVYPDTDLYKECFPNDGPLDWYERIMTDDLPWGELVYESPSITRNDLLDLVNTAYRSFYARDQWHNEAQKVLASNYPKVAKIVTQWYTDRLAIGKEEK